jgi:hypothetical protein
MQRVFLGILVKRFVEIRQVGEAALEASFRYVITPQQ